MKQLTKTILERALAAELTAHLGYEKHGAAGRGSGNSRNGASSKRLKGNFGTVEIEVPRDRASSFEPQLVAKRQTRWAGRHAHHHRADQLLRRRRDLLH